MNRIDEFQKALEGKPIHRRLYSLWQHFPEEDRTTKGFVDAHLRFQHQYNSDILKISPHGRYCIIDWGGEVGPTNPISGSPSTSKYPIHSANDYLNLAHLDPNQGEFGLQVQNVKELTKKLNNDVPTMMTIFCPLMVASKIDNHLMENLQDNPEDVHQGLQIITQVMIEFSKTVLEAGSHGLFIATQHSTKESLPMNHFLEFEVKYTMELIKKTQNSAEFSVMHLHGQNPRFAYISDHYPVSAINWHSETTTPSLKEATHLTTKALFGGLDDSNLLRKGSPTQVQEAVAHNLSITPNNVILAPGCVIPLDAPQKNLLAVVDYLQSQ